MWVSDKVYNIVEEVTLCMARSIGLDFIDSNLIELSWRWIETCNVGPRWRLGGDPSMTDFLELFKHWEFSWWIQQEIMWYTIIWLSMINLADRIELSYCYSDVIWGYSRRGDRVRFDQLVRHQNLHLNQSKAPSFILLIFVVSQQWFRWRNHRLVCVHSRDEERLCAAMLNRQQKAFISF